MNKTTEGKGIKYLEAPFGYKLTTNCNADNEDEVLQVCLDLSDDAEFQKAVKADTHKGRLKELKKMGFTINHPTTKYEIKTKHEPR